VCLGKTESKRQMRQKKLGLVPTFDAIVSSSPPDFVIFPFSMIAAIGIL
jgi:hypothetical protein